jgi:protein-S-isoprenylcysteine O-methyltransferase Ste14
LQESESDSDNEDMQTEKNDIRNIAFTYRSFTPIPFLIVMVFFAQPTIQSLLVGFLIVAVGEATRFWGVSIAGSETRTTGEVGGTFLITNGPFAYVRNPLYVGNMLLYAGVGVMSMALTPWLLIVAVIWFYIQYTLIVSREEEFLRGKFGSDYEHYCQHVNRFLPRLSAYVAPKPSPKLVSTSEGLASEKRTLQAIGLVTMVLVVMYFLRG